VNYFDKITEEKNIFTDIKTGRIFLLASYQNDIVLIDIIGSAKYEELRIKKLQLRKDDNKTFYNEKEPIFYCSIKGTNEIDKDIVTFLKDDNIYIKDIVYDKNKVPNEMNEVYKLLQVYLVGNILKYREGFIGLYEINEQFLKNKSYRRRWIYDVLRTKIEPKVGLNLNADKHILLPLYLGLSKDNLLQIQPKKIVEYKKTRQNEQQHTIDYGLWL